MTNDTGGIKHDQRRQTGVWLTWKQTFAVIGALATFAAAQHLAIYRFAFESAVDRIVRAQIQAHDENGSAHAALVQKVRDIQRESDDRIILKLEELDKRLSRIEGRLDEMRSKR